MKEAIDNYEDLLRRPRIRSVDAGRVENRFGEKAKIDVRKTFVIIDLRLRNQRSINRLLQRVAVERSEVNRVAEINLRRRRFQTALDQFKARIVPPRKVDMPHCFLRPGLAEASFLPLRPSGRAEHRRER